MRDRSSPFAASEGPWAKPFGLFFTFVVPILVIVNVPADTLVRPFDPFFIIWTIVAAVVMHFVSRCVFGRALQFYRSDSLLPT